MSALLEAEPVSRKMPDFSSDQRLVMPGDWDFYNRLLDARGENHPRLKITYNCGRLELMTVSNEHERCKKLLARIIEFLSYTTGGEIVCSGQMTIKRADLDRGFEPDECYYIQHAEQVREIRNLDFDRDPPPDLAIEIEISRSLADRLDVYAAVGVPEVWRFDGETLKVLHLQTDGTYRENAASLAFPKLDMSVVKTVFDDASPSGENKALRRFHGWITKNLLTPAGDDPAGKD